MKFYLKFLILIFTILYFSFSQAQNYQLKRYWDVPNKLVKKMKLDTENQKLYLVGSFDYFGKNVSSGLIFDKTMQYFDTNFVGSNYRTYCSVSDGMGGFYVGGEFTNFGDSIRKNLAHIDSNGMVTSFDMQVDSTIRTMILVDSILYLGGSFSSVNGELRQSLASINILTSQLTEWNPQTDGMIYNITHADSLLYVGGNFNEISGVPRKNIALISRSTGAAKSWNPQPDGVVNNIYFDGNQVFIMGSFYMINGLYRHKGAAFDHSNGALQTWNPNYSTGQITDLITDPISNRLIATISSSTSSYSFIFYIDKFNADSIEYVYQITDGFFNGMVQDEDILYVYGDFNSIGSENRKNVASFNISDSLSLTSWSPRIEGYVYNMSVSGDRIIFDGEINFLEEKYRPNFACVDINTGKVTDLVVDGIIENIDVSSIAIKDSLIFVSSFQGYNTIPTPNYNFKVINSNTGLLDPGWEFGLTNEGVFQIEVGGDYLFLLGGLSYYTGSNQYGYLIVNTLTKQLDQTISIIPYSGPNAPATIQSMKVKDSILYIGGIFTHINGIPRNNFAAYNYYTKELLPFELQLDQNIQLGPVTDIFVTNDFIMAKSLLYVNGQNQLGSDMNFFDKTTGELLDWTITLQGGNYTSLAYEDSVLFITGLFNSINNFNIKDISSIRFLDSIPNALNISSNTYYNQEFQIDIYNDNIYLAGDFFEIHDEKRRFLAAMGKPCIDPLFTLFQPEIPEIISNNQVVCLSNTNTTLQVENAFLNSADNWFWYKDSCDGQLIGTGLQIEVEPNQTTTYFVRGESSCVTNSPCASFTLVVDQPQIWIDSVTACGSYTWINGVTYLSSTTTPTILLTNSNGCDSLVNLHLNIASSMSIGITYDTVVACDSFTWIDGITYYQSDENIEFTSTSVLGCDSIINLNLILFQSSSSIDEYNLCSHLTWIDGVTYTESNYSATYTLQNVYGCDSVVNLYFTYTDPIPLTMNTYAQPTDTVNCNGNLVVTLNGNPPILLELDGQTIEVTDNYHLYTQLCVGVNSIVASDACGNSIAQNFVIVADSNYVFTNPFIDSLAVGSLSETVEDCEIDYNSIDSAYIDSLWSNGNIVYVIWNVVDGQGSHFDTTSFVLNNGTGVYYLQFSLFCPNRANDQYYSFGESIYFGEDYISSASLDEVRDIGLQLYPNPTNQSVTILFLSQKANLSIFDTKGKLLISHSVKPGEEIDLSFFESGMYLFVLNSANQTSTKRVIKL